MGLHVNDRRIAFVALVGGALALILMGPSWLRTTARRKGLVVMVPVMVLYILVGWHSSSPVFGPVATLRAIVDQRGHLKPDPRHRKFQPDSDPETATSSWARVLVTNTSNWCRPIKCGSPVRAVQVHRAQQRVVAALVVGLDRVYRIVVVVSRRRVAVALVCPSDGDPAARPGGRVWRGGRHHQFSCAGLGRHGAAKLDGHTRARQSARRDGRPLYPSTLRGDCIMTVWTRSCRTGRCAGDLRQPLSVDLDDRLAPTCVNSRLAAPLRFCILVPAHNEARRHRAHRAQPAGRAVSARPVPDCGHGRQLHRRDGGASHAHMAARCSNDTTPADRGKGWALHAAIQSLLVEPTLNQRAVGCARGGGRGYPGGRGSA